MFWHIHSKLLFFIFFWCYWMHLACSPLMLLFWSMYQSPKWLHYLLLFIASFLGRKPGWNRSCIILEAQWEFTWASQMETKLVPAKYWNIGLEIFFLWRMLLSWISYMVNEVRWQKQLLFPLAIRKMHPYIKPIYLARVKVINWLKMMEQFW